jgi:hypothetical protein
LEYEVIGIAPDEFPDEIERYYEDPRWAKSDLEKMRSLFPDARIALLRNGLEIDGRALLADIESYEIKLTQDSFGKVPSNYRKGWGSEGDDFTSSDGGPLRVWRPKNPDDEF